MKNLWSEVVNERMLTLMRLVGCDESFFDGRASDFECLAKWIAILPLLDGNTEAKSFAENIGNLLGRNMSVGELLHRKPAELWREYCTAHYVCEYLGMSDEKYNTHFSCRIDNICDEKRKLTSKTLSVNELICDCEFELEKLLDKLDNLGDFLVCAELLEGDFVRPDRYRAGVALKKIKSNEKCNNEEFNILISQLICEAIYRNDNLKIQLNFSRSDYIKSFIEYLAYRKMKVRIYVSVSVKTSVCDVCDVCRLSGNGLLVTPCLIAEKGIQADGFLEELSRWYPIGMLSFCENESAK